MTFAKGQSGNPAGRPRGARNKRTILAEKLFDEHAEELTRTAIQLANKGHAAALHVCMDRVFPRGKHRPVCFELRPIATGADALAAMGDIVQAVADGDLTAPEAAELSKMVQNIGHTATNAALEPRVAELEADAQKNRKLERLRRGR
jgi:hypothetical protein